MIDKLSCLEQLLLKAASVIGDIFDVQTLVKIHPFKAVVDSEKLLHILEDLE
jgi:predicted ATPase